MPAEQSERNRYNALRRWRSPNDPAVIAAGMAAETERLETSLRRLLQEATDDQRAHLARIVTEKQAAA